MTPHDPIKVYDARWETGDFSVPEIERFIESVLLYGRELGVDTITIARDARIGCGAVMEMAVEMAGRAGFGVYLCTDPISTPQSYFLSLWATRKHPHTMGLTITASHNPAGYVGMKIVAPRVQAIGLGSGPLGGFSRIRELYHGKDSLGKNGNGRLVILNLSNEYIDFSMEAAGVESESLDGMSVVLDVFNGSAGPELYRGIQRAGVLVDPLRLIPDGVFPTGSPNPTSQGKMQPAVQRCRETDAILAIGADGDGDRLVFGDARGKVDAGFVFAPVLHALLATHPSDKNPVVLYDPKVSPPALAQWRKMGVQPLLYGNGHSLIKGYMGKINALAAVEESGHYYHQMTLDGISAFAENSLLTILLLLRYLKERPGTMDAAWNLQTTVFTTGEVNYQFSDERTRDGAAEAVLAYFSARNATMVSESRDGVDLMGTLVTRGVDLPGGMAESEWYSGFIRASTNEKAVLRWHLSAGNDELGNKTDKRIREILDSMNGRLIE